MSKMEKGKKILVADDDRFMREMLRVILGRSNYEVAFAADGAEALEIAATMKPDLVLTDGLLPKIHGFVVCKTLKDSENPPKVVLLTAVYTKPSYRWQVKKEYGADDIISKPVKADDLIACIEKHLASRSKEEPAPSEDDANRAAIETALTDRAAMQVAACLPSGEIMPADLESKPLIRGFSVVPAL